MEKIKQALEMARKERLQQKAFDKSIQTVQELKKDRPKSKNVDEIVYSKTKVHSLDKDTLKRNRVLVDAENDEADTAYRMLRTQVLQKLVANEWNSLAVTSPGVDQGKTLTALNLAISLAREVNYTVLLVDFDLRRPGVHKCLDIKPQAGISDFLIHDTPLDQILVNPGIDRLVLLPGREALSNSSEMLKSKKVLQLVDELKSRYPSRLIIFDLPPILATDDALAFSPFVESIILVIEEGKTKQEEIEHSMKLLKETNFLGTVLNKSKERQQSPY